MSTAVKPAVGEQLVLELTAWGRLGEAMADHEGRDVFVFGGIPGERVVAEVVDIRRRRLAARVLEVLDPSSHRVDPPCPYFGDCTGCQWLHIELQASAGNQTRKGHRRPAASGPGFTDTPVAAVIPSTSSIELPQPRQVHRQRRRRPGIRQPGLPALRGRRPLHDHARGDQRLLGPTPGQMLGDHPAFRPGRAADWRCPGAAKVVQPGDIHSHRAEELY